MRLLLRLLRRLRRAFPRVRVQLRADPGFAMPELYEFCETLQVGYAIGIGANPVLARQAAPLQAAAQLAYAAAERPQRLFAEFRY